MAGEEDNDEGYDEDYEARCLPAQGPSAGHESSSEHSIAAKAGERSSPQQKLRFCPLLQLAAADALVPKFASMETPPESHGPCHVMRIPSCPQLLPRVNRNRLAERQSAGNASQEPPRMTCQSGWDPWFLAVPSAGAPS